MHIENSPNHEKAVGLSTPTHVAWPHHIASQTEE
jgi:hypothetical protein